MKNPERARNAALIWTLIGAAGIVIPYLLIGEPKKDTLAGLIPIAGLSVAFLGFCYLIFTQVELRRKRRLCDNPDAVRWTVAPEEWREFVALNDQLNEVADSTRYTLDRSLRERSDPVEVVIDSRAVLIGDDFHSFPVGGFNFIQGPYWIDGPLACMEIRFTNYGGETTSASSWAVRVPVARGAENAAARIFEQQRERLAVYSPPAKPQNYRLKRNIAIGVAFVSAAAFGMAMLLAKKCPPGWQIAVMVTAITGALLCPAALLCAAVWHWSDKSE